MVATAHHLEDGSHCLSSRKYQSIIMVESPVKGSAEVLVQGQHATS